MLNRYDQQLCKRFPDRRRSHCFNSFFVERLLRTRAKISPMEFCYEGVTSWTKALDIFALDKIIFPINIGNMHWTLACVHMQRKEIHYFDSMYAKGNMYTTALLQWVEEESIKKKKYFDKNEWKLIDCEDNPKQNNSFDCGAFVIACADFLIDDLPINTDSYSQDQMPQWRMKIATDILRKQLRY